MKRIDLDNLTISENKRLNEISFNIRKDYDRLIEEVSSEHINNIHWIVGGIASRNKYQSPLFYRCVQLAFINDFRRGNEENLIILSSDLQLCKLLKEQLAKSNEIICTQGKVKSIWNYFRLHRQYLLAVYFLIMRMVGRKKQPNIDGLKQQPITLVDTFVLNNKSGDDGSIVKNQYKDRYYPGLLEGLEDSEKQSIYFIPTIIGFKNPISIFKKIRKADFNFLIHDDFLKFRDYLFVLSQPFRISKLKLPKAEFMGYQMYDILENEKLKSSSDFISLLGLLYYRFTERLSQHGVKVKLVIEWYENQVLDRGMIKGFHTFYPGIPVYGYQGYIISKDLHLYTQPSRSEYLGGVVPDKVLVTGKGLKENIKEFCNEVVVEVAPGFRFSKVWRERLYYPPSSFFSVLVGLPIGLNDSKHILELLVQIKESFDVEGIKFFIKPHPTWTETKIKSMFSNEELDDFHFVIGDFHDNVEKSNLVISNASSVSLEALAKGVPVIIVAPLTGVIQNPIPKEVTNDIWKVIYTPDQLKDTIDYFNNPELIKQLNSEFDSVKNNFFEPVSKQGIQAFLNL
jgi:hypothetical protein